MKNKLWTALVAVLMAVGFAVSTPTVAISTGGDDPPGECIPSEGGWQRYSLTGGSWPEGSTPAFPDPGEPFAWVPNVKGDPHNIGQEGAYSVSHGQSGNTDWFYLELIEPVECPPEECPEGQVGTPPNCETPPEECPEGQVGTPPNCEVPEEPECPKGQTGTPPDCETPEPPCPNGDHNGDADGCFGPPMPDCEEDPKPWCPKPVPPKEDKNPPTDKTSEVTLGTSTQETKPATPAVPTAVASGI